MTKTKDEYLTDAYSMFSGQADAVERKYHKYVGKSGNIWLVADQDCAAENVYVTNNPRNTSNENSSCAGFGGATLKMPIVDGTIFELHGGWHSNSDALFEDTGVDVRNTCRTFVVLSKKVDYKGYQRLLKGIVYKDEKPTLGKFDRYKDLIKQYPEAKFYYMQSKGGSSSGPCNNS